MKNKINSILNEVLEKINPPKKELDIIENSLKEFLVKFGKSLKSLKINAEIFVGGSYAKYTMIQKKNYDIDIFVRFENSKNLSASTKRALKTFDFKTIHGSRDYFRVKISPSFFIEIIPVMKIKNPKDAENITDLSYSHVNYIKTKIKSQKILDEIKLAKIFCYVNHCYGAESYIKGFSGYSLELLIYYYGSFLKFIKAISKMENKIVLDIEKQYKNKQEILMDLNSSKLKSPIILIDPTYKQRNTLAALSEETFGKFKKTCKKFLKNPSIKAFEIEEIDLEKIKQNSKKKGYELILLETKTDRQEGDIAGTKLLKFYNHLNNEIEKFFEVKKKGFNYNGKKSARYFFVVKNKEEILIEGPKIKDKKNIIMFKKKHRHTFIKSKRIYAKEKIRFSIEKFINNWKNKNRKRIKEMGVKKLRVI